MTSAVILELADPRWSEFVTGHRGSTPFHHPAWAGLIAGCYGFRTFALAAADDKGTIRSGMPVAEIRHPGGRARWVSLPYTDYCPPLVSGKRGESELLSALRESSASTGIRRIEVRGPLAGGCVAGREALRHVLPLDGGPLEVYSRFHPSQVRRNIRRAEREGLTVRSAVRPHDLVDTFYGLHLRTRRRLGVPVQPRRFFSLLWEQMISTGLGSVLIVEASGRALAAAVFLRWNDTVIYKFGASEADAWSMRPNHLLFWHAIRAACEGGYRWFDFGRTDIGQTGLRDFKLSWGTVEEPLVYRTLGDESQPSAAAGGMAARMLGPVIRHSPLLVCRAAGEALYRFTA